MRRGLLKSLMTLNAYRKRQMPGDKPEPEVDKLSSSGVSKIKTNAKLV